MSLEEMRGSTNKNQHTSFQKKNNVGRLGRMKSKSFNGPSPCFSDELSGYITVQLSGWPQISLSEKVGEVGVFHLHRSTEQEIAKT